MMSLPLLADSTVADDVCRQQLQMLFCVRFWVDNATVLLQIRQTQYLLLLECNLLFFHYSKNTTLEVLHSIHCGLGRDVAKIGISSVFALSLRIDAHIFE